MPVNKQAKTGIYYKMYKNNSSFKAGETGNPNGRPKGAKSSSTREWAKMRKLAVDDYHEAYKDCSGLEFLERAGIELELIEDVTV